MHLINDGVTVNGGTATVEFTGSGPTASFLCNLDGHGFSPCELVQDICGVKTFNLELNNC